MSYQQSEEAIVRLANQYIEENKSALWFEAPESIFDLTKLRLTNVEGITTFEPLNKFEALTTVFIGHRTSSALTIPSLKGLEAATSIERLSFNCPTMVKEGIGSIGQLKKLKCLGLFHLRQSVPENLIADLDQLIGLTLSAKNYQSIQQLPPNLLEINLNFNAFTAIPTWNHSPSVQRVSCGKNSCLITTLDSFKVFPNIRHIELYNPKQLTDISQAANLQQLQELETNLAAMKDLKVLANHPTLEILKIRGTQVSSLADLVACKRLRVLNAEKSMLSSLEGVQGLTAIESLFVGESRIRDLSPLRGKTTIEELSLAELAPDSWDIMPTLTGLKRLDLCHSTFKDTSLLFRLPALKFVNLAGCPVDTNSNQYKSFAVKLQERGGGIR